MAFLQQYTGARAKTYVNEVYYLDIEQSQDKKVLKGVPKKHVQKHLTAQDWINSVMHHTNKTIKDIPLTLRLENASGRIIEAEGKTIAVPKEGQGKGSFFIVLPNNIINERKLKLQVGIYEGDKKITTLATNFMGPIYRGQKK